MRTLTNLQIKFQELEVLPWEKACFLVEPLTKECHCREDGTQRKIYKNWRESWMRTWIISLDVVIVRATLVCMISNASNALRQTSITNRKQVTYYNMKIGTAKLARPLTNCHLNSVEVMLYIFNIYKLMFRLSDDECLNEGDIRSILVSGRDSAR